MVNENEEKKKSNIHQLRDAAHNMPSRVEFEPYLEKLNEIDSRLAIQKASYMSRCKIIREDKKEILEDAAGKGLNTKAITAIHKNRIALAKILATPADLDEDTGPQYEHMAEQMDMFADCPRLKKDDPTVPSPKKAAE